MEKQRTKCEICGSSYINLSTHVIQKHKTTMEEYYKLYPHALDSPEIMSDEEADNFFTEEATADITEAKSNVEKAKITPQEVRDKVFKKDPTMVDEPLSEFLREFEITERELRQIVRQYKTGSAMTALESIERQAEVGEAEAVKLVGKGRVETTNLQTAETLKKKHGYTVLEARHGPPKTWVLIKK